MDNQNITPPQYTKLQSKKNKKQDSSLAFVSLIISVISLLCCFPPVQLIFGGLAIMFAFLSKQEDEFEHLAMIGLTIGIISCITSIFIFWLLIVKFDELKTDPEYISQLNTVLRTLKQLWGL